MDSAIKSAFYYIAITLLSLNCCSLKGEIYLLTKQAQFNTEIFPTEFSSIKSTRRPFQKHFLKGGSFLLGCLLPNLYNQECKVWYYTEKNDAYWFLMSTVKRKESSSGCWIHLHILRHKRASFCLSRIVPLRPQQQSSFVAEKQVYTLLNCLPLFSSAQTSQLKIQFVIIKALPCWLLF